MASGTMSDLEYYATSPQPLAPNNNELERAGAELYDSFGQPRLHGGADAHASNSRAMATNGYGVSPTLPRSSSPDEFYKGIMEPSQSANGPSKIETPKSSSARQQPSSASRSASSSATPKYPPIAQSRSQPSKPSHRSASAPVVERVQPRVGRSAAVQDMIKRFDQKSGQASSIPRGTSRGGSPRIPDISSATPAGGSRTAIRPGQATREPFSSRVKSPQPPRTTQRTKFTVEDQHSNNTLSSASREPKRRSRGNTSEEMPWAGNLSSNHGPPPSSRPPLFGEIVMSESGSQIPYGISEPRGRARRSVDSTINTYRTKDLIGNGQGSSPSSPTEDWYRAGGANSRGSSSPDFPGKHLRSMSDSYSQPEQPPALFGSIQEPKVPMKSRLPVMSKPSGLSPTASVSNTGRASSALSKRIASNSSDYQSVADRPYSPSGHVAYNGRGNRGPRSSSKTPANIRTIVSPLSPPMKSPPLRSSRIRMPVSSASTASSRNKMTDKATPGRSRAASRAENGDNSRSGEAHYAGKPDFAARRARIQEGMSKRAEEIKEKEQQAHERAEMEEAAKLMHEDMSDEIPDSDQPISNSDVEAAAPQQASFVPEESPIIPQDRRSPFHSRSPALGMPGSFPISQRTSADTPMSAVSTNSVETLFDNELQTEPPTQQEIKQPEIKEPPLEFGEYSPKQMVANNHEIVNFTQLLAEAKTDLGGDSERSYRYSDDDSPVFLGSQPQPYDMSKTSFNEEDDAKSDARAEGSLDTSHGRPLSPAPPSLSHNFNLDHSTTVANPILSDTMQPTEAAISEGTKKGATHSPRPSLHLQPTSPPRSSNSQLPKLQTSASHLAPMERFTSQDNAMSAVTDIDGDCSASSSESPRLSIEGMFAKRPIYLQAYDVVSDQRRPTSSNSAFRKDNRSSWPEGRITEEQITKLVHGGPPPPPKEPIQDLAPAVPPKSDGYTPLLTPRPQGDYPGAAKSHASSNEFLSFRARSTEAAQHARSIERTSSSGGPVSANPSIHSTDPAHSVFGPANSSSPNLWDHQLSLSLKPYPVTDHNSRRESGDTGPYRPSTSTARSSAFISNGSENADTPVSSTDQMADVPVPHVDCPVGVAEFASILQRKNHLMELVDTEAAFNKDMNVLVEIYQGTAVAVPDLKPADIRIIFRNANQIIDVSKDFLSDLKEATMPVYVHRTAKAKARIGEGHVGEQTAAKLYPTLPSSEIVETKQNDEKTFVGQVFLKHIPAMLKAYTRFINGSSAATMRIKELTEEYPSIKVWLEECNDAASDLSAAWDLGSMLVKPMQRITKYPMMINDLLKQSCKEDIELNRHAHPDRKALEEAWKQMDIIVKRINADTARVEIVLAALSDQRKKKEVQSSTGVLKNVFRRDKPETTALERASEDPKYLFCIDRYHSEFARIEIIIRDIQQYIDNVSKSTGDFLRLLSAIELVVRASASSYPELESKWARFNLSMRDMGTIGLEQHVKLVTSGFLGPFRDLSRAYNGIQPTLALRNKRRPKFAEYEKLIAKLAPDDKSAKSKIDEKLSKAAREFTALNDTLTLELPKLAELNEKLKSRCLGGFVIAQSHWYSIWSEKLRTVLDFKDIPVEIQDIVDRYLRDSSVPVQHVESMKLVNGTLLADARAGRNSESTVRDDETSTKSKSRTSTINDRSRGYSMNSDYPPSAYLSPALPPTQNEQSPSFSTANSSGFSLAQSSKRDTAHTSHGGDGAGSYDTARISHSYRSVADTRRSSASSMRPPRPSGDSFAQAPSGSRSPIATTQINPGGWVDGLPPAEPAFSDVFKSALPWSNSDEDVRIAMDRSQDAGRPDEHALKTIYVVASLCPFFIDGTKTEANYPYLTYQEGEIFDVVAEKGELWLAKNQDDASGKLGWIWNQHFARIDNDD